MRTRRLRYLAAMTAVAGTMILSTGGSAAQAAAGAGAARADVSACSDFNGPKCRIQLSTGITMTYREVGPASGPAIFLLHGYTDSSTSWERVVPVLHALLPQADIIIPDLRGFGDSSMPSGAGCPADPASCFQWKQFAADIIAFMDARHIARAAIVGHSVGTLVAQELGLDYPQRVSRLVLISTAATGQEPAVEFLLDDVVDGLWESSFAAQGFSWPDDVYNLTPGVAAPDFTDFIDNQWVTSSVAPAWFLNRMRAETAAVRLGSWIGPLENITTVDNTQRLEHLTVPTLVLYAIQDDTFSQADEQTLINALTVAASNGGSFWWKEYGVLPAPADGSQTDLGHNLPWEAPVGVATDIASFLDFGRPTAILYHTDYPADIHRIVAEPGKAVLIHSP